MKQLFFVAFLLMTTSLWAQERPLENEASAEAATTEWASYFELDELQQVKMLEIQERRLRNLGEIQSLRNTSYQKFLVKRRSIERNTLDSYERLLKAEQMPLLVEIRHDRRKRESNLIRRLRAEGKSREQIERAILELE